MKNINYRLYFIDAIRAWAILMMLQGHFIDGLLDPVYKDNSSLGYSIWKYFRGMTAPVFFTVSGFIFTYLLVRGEQTGIKNPRVKKGVKRGVQLIIIGYLLRVNIWNWFGGYINSGFFLVDVLHCIGLSILGIISIYLLVGNPKLRMVFPIVLLALTCISFLFEPYYDDLDYTMLPTFLENYISKINGSVFTIIPWFGYTTFGGFMALLFTEYKKHKNLYTVAIGLTVPLGLFLIFGSSAFFVALSELTESDFLEKVYNNNYLFIRLGDVLLIFAVFMLFRNFIKNAVFLKIGQSTLAIYVIHFIILYGSFTGFGLYRFLKHSLSPTMAILGAIVFMIICSVLALLYDRHETEIKSVIGQWRSSIANKFR